jgi:hypothetical protein
MISSKLQSGGGQLAAGGGPTVQLPEHVGYHDTADRINGHFRTRGTPFGKLLTAKTAEVALRRSNSHAAVLQRLRAHLIEPGDAITLTKQPNKSYQS